MVRAIVNPRMLFGIHVRATKVICDTMVSTLCLHYFIGTAYSSLLYQIQIQIQIHLFGHIADPGDLY